MTFLQIFFIISGIVIFLFSFHIARKERFNALHFLVFILVGVGLLVFTLFPQTLNFLGNIFGLERGADALVYISIIFLIYFVLLLLKKTESNREELSRLVRTIALEQAKHAKK